MSNIFTKVDWRNGLPYSPQFEDIYFSIDNGIAETSHVFIEHNQLIQRWEVLGKANFTIAETGFGTGLNFLCAWKAWLESAPNDATLHFISFEKYPLDIEDMRKATMLWPELNDIAVRLLAVYQPSKQGLNEITLDHGRVKLSLIVADVLEAITYLNTEVDAWFLDGFSPSKNPEMWQPVLFKNMARLANCNTTFSTFTSAGIVRRGLEAAGFRVKKVPGYGRKREMLTGQFTHPAPPASILPSNEKRAIVIGGGIAGTSSSYALASRGWQVSLIERQAALAQEASGNPLGVLYPRLTAHDTNLNRMALYGYLHTNQLLKKLGLGEQDYQACGLLQLAFNQREIERQAGILSQKLPAGMMRQVDASEASTIAGVSLEHGGLYLPEAGWVSPPALCDSLAIHDNIQVKLHQTAIELRRSGGLWQAWSDHKLLAEASVVIITSANETMRFAQSSHCLLEPVRGQITLAEPTEQSRQLKTVICTEAYISPLRQGIHCMGATFSNGDTTLDIRETDHQANLALVKKMSSDLSGLAAMNGRAALRCASPDYLPLAGRLLDSGLLKASPPRHNADPSTLPWLAGLYVNAGHGSKGLITAPLCAEIIACALNNEPAPVDDTLMAALDPNRFLLREMGLKRLLSTPYCKIST